jgi:hypothetical protein
MEFARKLEAETVSALPVSALHELIKIPEAARAEVIKQLIAWVNAGERLTKTKVSEAVQQLKSEQAEAAPPLAEPESNTPPPTPEDEPESAAEPKAKSQGEPRPPRSQASALAPRPPVSRRIDSLEIDRLISPKLERIKAKAKRVDQPQISLDIILLVDKIQVQIAKWTTDGPAASPDSEAQAAE